MEFSFRFETITIVNMDNKYNETIRPILDVFDQIQHLLRNEQIELPKIVVVGDQSSGKSSVLEAITGISLPRGTGTVTKCPIIIQSRLAKSEDEEGAVISMNGYQDTDKISLTDLSKQIAQYQDMLISSNHGEITDTPINIKLSKILAPDLTLYDLPGITYKAGVTNKIRDMILKYTQGKDTIILLIIASNMDFRTTEAIELIQSNSDYKERTIAVLTKIDLGNQERGLYEKLVSNDLDLRFDPIVVRNRTQEEIDDEVSIEEIRQKEAELIESSDLKKLSKNSKGTPVLINKLIEIQKNKLISCKYDIRLKIIEKIAELKKSLSKLPKAINSVSDKMDVFKDCLAEFSRILNSYLDNKVLCDDKEKNITFAIRKICEKNLAENFQQYHSYYLSDEFFELIEEKIHMSIGFNLANFNDFKVFESIMIQELEKIKIEVLLDDVKVCILNFLDEHTREAFDMYPELARALRQEIISLFKTQLEKAESLITELLNIERSLIYTANPYYIDMVDKIKNAKKEMKKNGGLPNANFQLDQQIHAFLKAHYNEDMAVVNVQISW